MIKKKAARGSDKVKVTFILPGDHPYGAAAVVGDFNDWDKSVHPLTRRSNKTYSTTIELPKGEQFAFRYLANGEVWFNDTEADGYEPNGYGGENGIIQT